MVTVVAAEGDGHGGAAEVEDEVGEEAAPDAEGDVDVDAPEDSSSGSAVSWAALVAGLGGIGLGGTALARARTR